MSCCDKLGSWICPDLTAVAVSSKEATVVLSAEFRPVDADADVIADETGASLSAWTNERHANIMMKASPETIPMTVSRGTSIFPNTNISRTSGYGFCAVTAKK
jgi:hypothetical protein